MRLDFPGANAEIAAEKHVHQRIGLVRYLYAERFSDHRIPLRTVFFIEHLFHRLGRRLLKSGKSRLLLC